MRLARERQLPSVRATGTPKRDAARGDAQVACGRDHQTPAGRRSVDHRERRHGQRLDFSDAPLEARLVADAVFAGPEAAKLGDVGPGDKGPVRAAKDRRAQSRRRGDPPAGDGQFVIHRQRHRIAHPRTIEHDRRDWSVDRQPDGWPRSTAASRREPALAFRDPKLGENLVIVLAEQRRGPAHLLRRPHELDRESRCWGLRPRLDARSSSSSRAPLRDRCRTPPHSR